MRKLVFFLCFIGACLGLFAVVDRDGSGEEAYVVLYDTTNEAFYQEHAKAIQYYGEQDFVLDNAFNQIGRLQLQARTPDEQQLVAN